MTDNIPNGWFCPITMQIMTNPVICSDGQTYEKTAIEAWLVIHNISPITKQPITHITPNIALRDTIEEYLKKQIAPSPIEIPKPSTL